MILYALYSVKGTVYTLRRQRVFNGNALWQHGWSSHVLPVLMNTRSRRRRRVPAVTPTRAAAEKQRRMAIGKPAAGVRQ